MLFWICIVWNWSYMCVLWAVRQETICSDHSPAEENAAFYISEQVSKDFWTVKHTPADPKINAAIGIAIESMLSFTCKCPQNSSVTWCFLRAWLILLENSIRLIADILSCPIAELNERFYQKLLEKSSKPSLSWLLRHAEKLSDSLCEILTYVSVR